LQVSIKDIYKVDSKILYPVLDNKFLNYNSENKNKFLLSIEYTPINSLPLTRERGYSKVIFTYGRWVEGKNI
jgi:hypothetical protein